MTDTAVETQVCDDCGEPRPLADFRPGRDAGTCAPCRYGSIAIGMPSDFKTRTVRHVPRPIQHDSYAAGVPTDKRGMPWLGPDLSPIGQREHDRKRHVIDQFERDKRNGPMTRSNSNG